MNIKQISEVKNILKEIEATFTGDKLHIIDNAFILEKQHKKEILINLIMQN